MLTRTVALVALVAALGPAPAVAQSISYSSLLDAVGSGLQSTESPEARLSDSQHGGVFVTITVDDPALGLVAPDDATPGVASIDVFVPNGSTDANFVIQGLEGVTGTLTVTASAPGFTDAVDTVDIVAPYFDISGLLLATDVPDADDPFTVRVGLPNGGMTTLSPTQKARVGGLGVAVSVTSSDALVGELVTATTRSGVAAVNIAPGSSSTGTSVASGGVALDGIAAGTTTITATIPGFLPTTNATRVVVVSPAAVELVSLPIDVGAGLESQRLTARLNGGEHGGVSVRIESDDPAKLLVSATDSDPGQAFVDVALNNGATDAHYYLHGIENESGIVGITTSAIGFGVDTNAIDLVSPYFRISALPSSIDTFDPEDPFTVQVGLPNATASTLAAVRHTRPGGPGATVTLVTTDPLVGAFNTSSSTADSTVTVFIAANQGTSPSSVATGGVAFDGLAEGQTTVVASIPGYIPTAIGARSVDVTAPLLSVNLANAVGAGLMEPETVSLGATSHGGVTVSLSVDDPALGLVSATANDPGTPTVDIFVPDGSNQLDFFVHGLEGQTGVLSVMATAPGFVTDTETIDVDPPLIQIIALSSSLDVFDPDDDFYARVGAPTATSIDVQSVRAGAPNLTVTFSVDQPTVATLTTMSSSASMQTVDIPAGDSQTPNTVANGGVALDGLAAGTVMVSASASGYTPFSNPRTVTVNDTPITVSTVNDLGAGLQSSAVAVTLGGSEHGGTTVRIESLDPGLALVSIDPDTAGTAFVDAFVADGSTSVSYWLHGVDNQIGIATIQASAPGFVTGTRTTEVVQPGCEIVFLATSLDTTDPDDPFRVRVGVPSSNNATVSSLQSRRAGQPPLVPTVTTSNVSALELVTLSTTGDTVTTTIVAGTNSCPTTVAAGGPAARPVGTGSALVVVSIPGFLQTGRASVLVDVTNTGIAMPGVPAAIGAGLQVGPLTATLSDPFHGGVTATITSSDGAKLLVSADPASVGGTSRGFVLPNGTASFDYYLQAIDGVTGNVDVTSSAPGFNGGDVTVEIQSAAIEISQLVSSVDVNAVDDPFVVRIGVAEADGSQLAQVQPVRPGGALPTIDLSLSDPTLAQIVTLAGTADTGVVDIAAGDIASPDAVNDGGAALNFFLPGNLVVHATATGIVSTQAASHPVEITGMVVGTPVARRLQLAQNEPNPFNPATSIRYEIPREANVRLSVFDVSGRRVRALVDATLPAGTYESQWRGLDDKGQAVSSGTYFYVLETDGRRLSRKMMLLK